MNRSLNPPGPAVCGRLILSQGRLVRTGIRIDCGTYHKEGAGGKAQGARDEGAGGKAQGARDEGARGKAQGARDEGAGGKAQGAIGGRTGEPENWRTGG